MTDTQWERIFARLQEDIFARYALRQTWGEVDQNVIDFEISPAWRAIVEQELLSRPNTTFTRVRYPEDTSTTKGLPSIPVACGYILLADVTPETLIGSVNALTESMAKRNCVGEVLHCRATEHHLELEMRGKRLEAAMALTPPPDAYLP